MLATLWLLAMISIVVYGAARSPIARSDEPPAPAVTVEQTYRGVTAHRWYTKFTAMRHLAYQRKLQGRKTLRATIRDGYGNSWLERAFLCIHRYEGSWTDSGAPFYGGLQMDSGFQSTYGEWAVRAFGTADHWPISVQLSTAIQANVSGRGFGPWPNTARSCGLR